MGGGRKVERKQNKQKKNYKRRAEDKLNCKNVQNVKLGKQTKTYLEI